MTWSDLDALLLPELIELAKRRGVVDAVTKRKERYRVRIGPAVFILKEKDARQFLERRIRRHAMDSQ